MSPNISKKFVVADKSNQELGTVALEHLWADVYGMKYKRTDKKSVAAQWTDGIRNALAEAETQNARQVVFRLIQDEYSVEFSQLLFQLDFTKKNERVEYKKSVEDLPDDSGSPITWKSAEELGWNPQQVSDILRIVAEGDPDTDPIDDPLLFIQDFLADAVLSSGLGCIHIGFVDKEIAAMTVVQINPKSGWSRISYMGIVPRFRKQGLGQWVHRYSFKVMKLEGGKLYHGGTVTTNKSMIKLFELHQCDRFCSMEEWIYATKVGRR